ncbi:MAG: hypothetical protein QM690_16080 [Sphingobium sp.]
MTAELTRRPDGADRHPWDWYVEQQWVSARLLDAAPIDRDVVMLDPCCGSGNIVRTLLAAGFDAYGMDLFERGSPNFLGTHDMLGDQRTMFEGMGPRSIIFNPPFSCQDGRLVRGLAMRMVLRALDMVTHQVAALLPLKWLASEERYRLFSDHTPLGIWVMCERPSMPPGDQIAALGAKAWKRGKVDYVWIVWDKRRPPLVDQSGKPFAPTYWIPPREKARRRNLVTLAEAA